MSASCCQIRSGSLPTKEHTPWLAGVCMLLEVALFSLPWTEEWRAARGSHREKWGVATAGVFVSVTLQNDHPQ